MDLDQERWQLPRGQLEVLVVGRIEVHEGCQAVLCGVLDACGLRQVPFINLHMQGVKRACIIRFRGMQSLTGMC